MHSIKIYGSRSRKPRGNKMRNHFVPFKPYSFCSIGIQIWYCWIVNRNTKRLQYNKIINCKGKCISFKTKGYFRFKFFRVESELTQRKIKNNRYMQTEGKDLKFDSLKCFVSCNLLWGCRYNISKTSSWWQQLSL